MGIEGFRDEKKRRLVGDGGCECGRRGKMEAEEDGRDGWDGLSVLIEEGVMEQETWKRQAGTSDRAEVTFRSGCRCRDQVQDGLEGGGGRPHQPASLPAYQPASLPACQSYQVPGRQLGYGFRRPLQINQYFQAVRQAGCQAGSGPV